ncbi:LysM peptidoglycan-binding domain-containing protein [Chitinimonas koreensis]|uniref:LysM peptidoglycan-binding domain-containing protein n=1 Tax=Chitinimonas koreensis TaxID=356302 RepID=UPI00223FA866|nr:LysM peptidoglycan-binding domain-containing protein [Chitinimonas koreensis]
MRPSAIRSNLVSRLVSGVIITLAAALPALADELKLQDNAPERYVVVKGDTLWDISGKFLKDPWRWPQIWNMNRDEIKNPHWIYPGDVIVLDTSGGSPRLRLLGNKDTDGMRARQKLDPRIRVTQFEPQAAPAIPAQAIEPFLQRPLVVDEREFANARASRWARKTASPSRPATAPTRWASAARRATSSRCSTAARNCAIRIPRKCSATKSPTSARRSAARWPTSARCRSSTPTRKWCWATG